MAKACQHLQPLIDYLRQEAGLQVREVEPFGIIRWLGACSVPQLGRGDEPSPARSLRGPLD